MMSVACAGANLGARIFSFETYLQINASAAIVLSKSENES